MATYSTDILAGTITIDYSVANEGYITESATDVAVSDEKGSVDVALVLDTNTGGSND